MPSIKQNSARLPLPDFRNFGVMLRVLLGVNVIAFAAALTQGNGVAGLLQRYIDMAPLVQPLLLFNLVLLAAVNPLLRRLPPPAAYGAIIVVAAASAAQLVDIWRVMGFDEGGSPRMLRAALLAAAVAAAMLHYLALRAKAFSPAIAEARLQALTARIHPHFLFNSLTAVLSLIRLEPRRAETALEELAELFRALMREHRELLPLGDEIALCRQYLDLEKLRLGDRLNIEWQLKDVPTDLLVPPLMLQPLIENAVYHGIEPADEPGTVRIRLVRKGDELHIDLRNPCHEGHARQGGQHMALANIRERLALYYDLEARLASGEVTLPDGRRQYRVRIVLPCRRVRS